MGRTKLSALLLLPAFCLLPSAFAATFSGNARVEIPDPTGGLSWKTNINQLTVECWFKVSHPSGFTPSANMTLLVNRTTGTITDAHAYHFWYDKDARNIQFSTKGTNFWQGVLIGRIQFERLYHVAVTRNGTSLKAYVDGRRVVTTNVFVGDCRSTNGVSIGGWEAGKYLYGEVQEVAIYQTELDDSDIFGRLYTDQRNEDNLYGYYKLGYSTNREDHYKNFAPSPPAVTGAAIPAGSTGQILFEETNQKGEQSLFDSQVNGGKNAVTPLSGAFAWQQSVFSRPVPGVPFDFTIGYSPGTADSDLGPGWNHSLAPRVITKGSTLQYKLITWQGGVETWERPSTATNSFTTGHGEYRGELKALPSAEVEWTTPQRLIYRFREPGNPELDSMAGRLMEIRDTNGNSLTLQWNISSHYITNVVDSTGGSYHFAYKGSLLTNLSYGAWQVQFSYDNDGRLASKTLTNTSGQYTNVVNTAWQFFYHGTNRLLDRIVNPSGYTNLFVQYDDNGRRINTINALGDSTRMEYGTPGNRQIRTTDAGGFQWVDTYDRKGRVIAQRDPLGHETRYAYDEHGNRTAVTDPQGNTTFSGYDERGNLLAQTNALGEVTRWAYHPFFNKPSNTVDALNWNTRYEYDERGNLTNQFDNLGRLASFTYTANGLLLTKTDAIGRTTTNAYNADGFVTAQTDAATNTTHFTPNELGWNLKTLNALNEETTYAYDLNGKVVRTVDPLARTLLASYDACGDMVTNRDAKGQESRFTYDALRRKTSEVDRALGTNRFDYTPRGKLASTTDALSRVTTYQYDNANRQTAVVDALENTTTTVYDANGNAVATIDPLGRRWSKTLDRLNRVVAETDPLGNTTQTLYDPAGRVRETIGPNGSRTVNAYDNRARLTNWVDAAGSSWNYAYDGVGNITNLTDARLGQYVMAYGPRNERTLERNQDGKEWRYTYDALLRLQTNSEPNGISRTLYYDAGGRMTNVGFSTGRANSLSYDANDNVTRLSRTGSGPPDTTLLHYDSLDRVSRYTNTFGQTVAYDYDAAGRLKTLTYPYGSATLTHSYDALDHLTNQFFQLAAGQTYTTSYAYDPVGQLIRRVYPNGMVQTNTFDPAGRLTGLSHAPLNPQPSTLNVALAYAYDRNGNSIRADEKGVFQWPVPALRNETAGYRPSGQLIQRDLTITNTALPSIAYHYDASGNMTNAVGAGQTWNLT